MANVNEGATIALNANVWVTCWQLSGGVYTWKRLPLSAINAAALQAAAALTPDDVADMAYEDPADFVRVTDLQANNDAMQAQITLLQDQINQLLAIVGESAISVYDPGIYEEGIYA